MQPHSITDSGLFQLDAANSTWSEEAPGDGEMTLPFGHRIRAQQF